MKLYAICLVKNEGDIIAQTLTYATRYCDKILVIDNGSTDGTWETVQNLSVQYPQVVPFTRILEPFDNGFRWLAYDAYHKEISESDWWMILDGDEFLAEDPRPVIKRAMDEGADIVKAWQIQFYYTERDYDEWLAGDDSRERPIFERRRYYSIDYQEPRLFRNRVSGAWDTAPICRSLGIPPWLCSGSSKYALATRLPPRTGRISRHRILNRHFQYRDPEQIEKRFKLRFGNPLFSAQVSSLDWRVVLRPSGKLQYYEPGKPWRFSASGLLNYYTGWFRYVAKTALIRTRCGIVRCFR